MSELHEIATEVTVIAKRDAGMFLHYHVGTVGPEGGRTADMIRDAGTGMLWHITCGDSVAVVDIRDLLTKAAALVLEAPV